VKKDTGSYNRRIVTIYLKEDELEYEPLLNRKLKFEIKGGKKYFKSFEKN